MTGLYSVAQIRRAEQAAFAVLPEGTLMQRAAFALAVACVDVLDVPSIPGSRIVLLVGSGGNGGDALWAGAFLAQRGCRVDAVCVGDSLHAEGSAALVRAGGRIHAELDPQLLRDADLVIDGIVGIGGKGPLRDRSLATSLRATGAIIVAVDIPSGVDADTGAADPDAVVAADLTVTFGAAKPGLFVSPGREFSGQVRLVEIGLEFDEEPVAEVLDPLGVALALPMPGADDYKYSRGVVGIVAGSDRYRGAALLCTGAAASANVGMVVYLDRGDGIATEVVQAVPEIVTFSEDPASNDRVDAWVVGPGIGDDPAVLGAVLATRLPVVIDADALRMCTHPAIRASLAQRHERGLITVMTPHVGEFKALGFEVGTDRLAAAKAAASELHVVMVLKGAGTIVASDTGRAFVDVEGTEVLGTAGSGDVLSGLIGAFVAANRPADGDAAARIVAAAVAVHGLAGTCAELEHGTVNATNIMDAIPDAFASVPA